MVSIGLVLCVVAALPSYAYGQSIQTVNGSMVLTVPGASLTLATIGASTSAPAITFATQDQVTNQQLQVLSLHNATSARIDALGSSISARIDAVPSLVQPLVSTDILLMFLKYVSEHF